MRLFPLGVHATTYNVALETCATFTMGPWLYAKYSPKVTLPSRVTFAYPG